MANLSESLKCSAITSIANPTVTISNNNSVVPFNVKLNGKNYNTWSKMMVVHASIKGNRGYLTRKVAQVVEEDLYFDA